MAQLGIFHLPGSVCIEMQRNVDPKSRRTVSQDLTQTIIERMWVYERLRVWLSRRFDSERRPASAIALADVFSMVPHLPHAAAVSTIRCAI